jgi:hypothetical protein
MDAELASLPSGCLARCQKGKKNNKEEYMITPTWIFSVLPCSKAILRVRQAKNTAQRGDYAGA